MHETGEVYIIGDVHGQYRKLLGLLRDAGLIDGNQAWAGGPASLWFLGDFCDRGPDGIGVVDLVMRLQAEATEAGGQVGALLGNHEVLILAAAHFGSPLTGQGAVFMFEWQRNGGQTEDLARLTPRHIDWISNLPAMALVADRLLIHADALLYLDYGATIDEVNAAFRAVLASRDMDAYDRFLGEFSARRAFADNQRTGAATALAFLQRFGGSQLIHGHTPISAMTRQPPAQVTAPLVYAGGRCVNVDAGLFLGSPGFVYHLPPLDRITEE
jgi:hypothetical protein